MTANSFLQLTGSLFNKELRVASRRRRSYTLRLAYVIVLTVYIAIVWVSVVELQGSATMSRAKMEMAAKMIVVGIVWFQFIGAQVVVLVLMSTAISEEIYSRTLAVLMTTPLSSRQVVMNKFFSRLFQVLLLVATSLPLLALVRVLGGIPWSYLIVSLCVTAATVVFVGAVSLLFSTLCKRTYNVVILSVLTAAFLFALVPPLSLVVLDNTFSEAKILRMCQYWNPYLLLYGYTDYVIAPSKWTFVSVPQIIWCCALLLCAAAVVLRGAVRLVQSVALRRAMGEPVLLERLRRGCFREEMVGQSSKSPRHGLRRVVGPPMIWKELTCTLSRRHRLATAIILGVEILLIIIVYSFGAVLRVVPYEAAHMLYVWAFLGLGAFFTITAAGTVITVERESRTWPLLLVTSLTDGDILLGKFVGVLRRSGPIWLSLFAYIAAFAWARCFHPLAILQATAMILSVLLFLSATGFYFGSRFRRTSEAVTANLVLAGALWCALPIIGAAAEYGMRTARWNVSESVAFASVPFAQAFAMVTTTLDGYNSPIRCLGRSLDAPAVLTLMFFSLSGYVLVSVMFTWRAVRAFRRNIF